jgi:hypothetical protein
MEASRPYCIIINIYSKACFGVKVSSVFNYLAFCGAFSIVIPDTELRRRRDTHKPTPQTFLSVPTSA